jgi:hypothetical protein
MNAYECRLLGTVTPRNRYTFFIDDDQRRALTQIKERDGISESEQIRRAIKAWIETRTVTVKTPNRRAGTRRKG